MKYTDVMEEFKDARTEQDNRFIGQELTMTSRTRYKDVMYATTLEYNNRRNQSHKWNYQEDHGR